MANNWTGITTVEQVLEVANTNTNGWFWVSMLWLIFVVLLVSLSAFGFEAAILSASFAALIVGLFLAYMGLVGWYWVAMFVALILVIFLIIGYKNKGQ